MKLAVSSFALICPGFGQISLASPWTSTQRFFVLERKNYPGSGRLFPALLMFPLPLVITLPQEYLLNHAAIPAQQHLLLHQAFEQGHQIVWGAVVGKEVGQHGP